MNYPLTFGFKKGMTYAQLRAIDPTIEHYCHDLFILSFPPERSDLFDNYAVNINSTIGLYRIGVTTGVVSTDSQGILIRKKVDEIIDYIRIYYGEPDKITDALMIYAVLEENKNWMRELIERRRVFMVQWNNDNIIKKGIYEINVSVFPIDTNAGSINIDLCLADFNTTTRLMAEGMKNRQ